MCRAADHWHEYGGVCNEHHGKSREELEAKVERLRTALERIANGGYEGRGDSSLSPGGVTRFTYTKKGLRAIARAALAEEEA